MAVAGGWGGGVGEGGWGVWGRPLGEGEAGGWWWGVGRVACGGGGGGGANADLGNRGDVWAQRTGNNQTHATHHEAKFVSFVAKAGLWPGYQAQKVTWF